MTLRYGESPIFEPPLGELSTDHGGRVVTIPTLGSVDMFLQSECYLGTVERRADREIGLEHYQYRHTAAYICNMPTAYARCVCITQCNGIDY